MKSLIAAVLALLLCSGCGSLIPKQVEFFQKKVHAVPDISNSARERQREAAEFIARHEQTNRLANALSASLGPPESPFTGEASKLAGKLNLDLADLNEDLQDYRENVDPLVGKKIEGTGWFQIGYFSYVALIGAGLLLLWFGVRVYGLFNPVVGTAAGIAGRVSSSVLTKGFSEVVSGGQQFLQWVSNSNLASETKDWIVNTFKVAHQTQQSADVQAVVDKLVTPAVNQTNPVTPTPKQS